MPYIRSLSLLFLMCLAGTRSLAGEFKPRIDALEIKFTRSIRDTQLTTEQKKITAIISTAEAIALCAEIEMLPSLVKPLTDRLTQFREAVKSADTPDEKIYHAGIGIFNFLLMITNTHAGLTPFQTPIRRVEKQALHIQRTDSLSIPMKSALMLSESFKLILIAAAAVDSLEKRRDEMKEMGLAFDEEARNVQTAEEGLAVAAGQLATIFSYYSILRFPGMKAAFEDYSISARTAKPSSDEKTVEGFTSLCYTVLLHARRLDLEHP